MTYIENLKPSKNIRQWNLIKKKKKSNIALKIRNLQ